MEERRNSLKESVGAALVVMLLGLPLALEVERSEAVETIDLHVEALACDEAAEIIAATLSGLEGVQGVEICRPDRTATVQVQQGALTPASIARVVEAAGFAVDSLEQVEGARSQPRACA